MGHAHSIKENPGQVMGIAAMSAMIGAITAMLITPKRGQELRHDISDKVGHSKDSLFDTLHSKKDDITDKVDDIQEQAKDKVADVAEKVKDAADKATDKTNR